MIIFMKYRLWRKRSGRRFFWLLSLLGERKRVLIDIRVGIFSPWYTYCGIGRFITRVFWTSGLGSGNAFFGTLVFVDGYPWHSIRLALLHTVDRLRRLMNTCRITKKTSFNHDPRRHPSRTPSYLNHSQTRNHSPNCHFKAKDRRLSSHILLLLIPSLLSLLLMFRAYR